MAKFPPTPEEGRVFLIDAVATSDNSLMACSGYCEAPSAFSTRIYSNFGEAWGVHEVSGDFMVSVAYRDGAIYAVGKNGTVKAVGYLGQPFSREAVKGKYRSFMVEPVETIGHLSRVRSTPSGFVVCGWGGQLYRLSGDSWISLADATTFSDCDLFDIDGTAKGDLYSCGMGGCVLYFDGQSWHREDMLTNRHFYAVRCLSDGSVLLAGSGGALYRGHHNQWREIETEADGNFWAIEEFQGAAYLTYANDQMFRLNMASGVFEEVDLGMKVHTYRLSAGPTTLLSIGSNALLRFDGMTWTQIECPDMA